MRRLATVAILLTLIGASLSVTAQSYRNGIDSNDAVNQPTDGMNTSGPSTTEPGMPQPPSDSPDQASVPDSVARQIADGTLSNYDWKLNSSTLNPDTEIYEYDYVIDGDNATATVKVNASTGLVVSEQEEIGSAEPVSPLDIEEPRSLDRAVDQIETLRTTNTELRQANANLKARLRQYTKSNRIAANDTASSQSDSEPQQAYRYSPANTDQNKTTSKNTDMGLITRVLKYAANFI